MTCCYGFRHEGGSVVEDRVEDRVEDEGGNGIGDGNRGKVRG